MTNPDSKRERKRDGGRVEERVREGEIWRRVGKEKREIVRMRTLMNS